MQESSRASSRGLQREKTLQAKEFHYTRYLSNLRFGLFVPPWEKKNKWKGTKQRLNSVNRVKFDKPVNSNSRRMCDIIVIAFTILCSYRSWQPNILQFQQRDLFWYLEFILTTLQNSVFVFVFITFLHLENSWLRSVNFLFELFSKLTHYWYFVVSCDQWLHCNLDLV